MRSTRSLSLAAAVLAASVVAVPAGPVQAAPARKVAYFNSPLGGNAGDPVASSSALTDRIVSLINEAEWPAVIRIGMYFVIDESAGTTDVDRIITALDQAVDENIFIRLVVDYDEYVKNPGAINRIVNLDAGKSANLIDAEFCTDGCYDASSSAKMHDKFLLIDHLNYQSGAENLVAVSSANWSDKQLRVHYHNDMVVTWGDTALYNAFRDYWEDLWWCAAGNESTCNSQGGPSPQSVTGSTSTAVHFYPQTSGDPQVTEVENVTCAGNKKIAVVMGSWSGYGTRGATLVNRLSTKKSQGCTVQALIPEDEPVRGVLVDYGVPFRCLGDGTLNDAGDRVGPGVHNKQILVDATYSGVAGSRIVFTGSTNMTYNALHENDEVWLKISSVNASPSENYSVYNAYRARFDQMWAQGFAC